MTDLNLTKLAAKLPANTFTQTADDVTVSLKTLTGEAAVQLDDEVVAETFTKLLTGASEAQVDHNAANPEDTIASYPAPNFGNPVASDGGGFTARRNHTVSVAIPLNVDEATAV